MINNENAYLACVCTGGLLGYYRYRNSDCKQKIYQIGKHMCLGTSMYLLPQFISIGQNNLQKMNIVSFMITGGVLGFCSNISDNIYNVGGFGMLTDVLWGIAGGAVWGSLTDLIPIVKWGTLSSMWFIYGSLEFPDAYKSAQDTFGSYMTQLTQSKTHIIINCNVQANEDSIVQKLTDKIKPIITQHISELEDDDLDETTNEIVDKITESIKDHDWDCISKD